MTEHPIDQSHQNHYVTPGMPPLIQSSKPVSFFEFWPTWVMYLPVVAQWLMLSLVHRSLTLPLIANPKLTLSGMVGVQKSDLLSQAKGLCKEAILEWFCHQVTDESTLSQLVAVKTKMKELGFQFPVVCKPDIGCRGAGVKLAKSDHDLEKYLKAYPSGASIMIQRLASYEPEAGVFYVKEPGTQQGKIISLALKYSPYVVGNGRDTLRQLIEQDHRARELMHLYENRHSDRLKQILPEGQPYKLVFSASHSKGAIFKNAAQYITSELSKSLDSILADLPEFHYGRLDIKFENIESLKAGKGIEIVEINTASSEPLHIWDGEASFIDAIRSLLFQYRVLFSLGSKNRKRGFKTPGLMTLIKHWKKEIALKKFYPDTD